MTEKHNHPVDLEKSDQAKKEEEILDFWEREDIFAETEKREALNGDYVFYDGPPFATGKPHFGHFVPNSLKDAIPRYQTMKGKRVIRRFGWDCHGLPIENIIEKELGFKTKKDIETYGIKNFNEAAKKTVVRYVNDWQKVIHRLGRWVDMDNDYKTMDVNYSESIWWAFKKLHDQGLIYQGFKSMHLCPRCETTLSNFEVTQGYKDITDISVYVKLELTEEVGTYLLAWTTTPWTLPGNVAAAVNPDLTYAKVEIDLGNDTLVSGEGIKGGHPDANKVYRSGVYIVAEAKVMEVFGDREHKIIDTFSGQTLVGKSYKPLFDYYVGEPLVNFRSESIDDSTIFRVYGADYVTLEKGTGVVHLAPAFGEEDMALALKENLPFIQHVGANGEFKTEVIDLVGHQAKPKDDVHSTDVEILKLLTAKNVLFAKSKVVHSYPHCWRCDTPLLNYASSSWFVKVTDFKERLFKHNEKIKWVPEHVGEGRFGNWLLGAPDWAISRTRYFGAPLPVWECAQCEKQEVIGSLADLKKRRLTNLGGLWLMRHGEAEANLSNRISDKVDENNPLTSRGEEEVKDSAKTLSKEEIDLIVASPFMRTKQTAEIMAVDLGLATEKIIFDVRLGEAQAGEFSGQTWSEYGQLFKKRSDRFTTAPGGGETAADINRRVMEVIFELPQKYPGQKILLVTHGLPSFLIKASLGGWSFEALGKLNSWYSFYLNTAEVCQLEAWNYPHNDNFEVDLHRPYIDDVTIPCSCGGEMKRVPDVFDCWFESGSMPFAQNHYPFETKKCDPDQDLAYPADFIAEGLDQTRGWFYSMLVLGEALFKKAPYKNVIVHGLVLAEDGQKMSKKLQNYPDVDLTINKYGADALRFYLLNTPAMKGEEVAFSEKNLAEVSRKVIGRLQNVMTFYQSFASGVPSSSESLVLLDQYLLARLTQTAKEVEIAFDDLETDRATRAIAVLIEDLSNWYLRRSRDRFKDNGVDRDSASATLRFALKTLAQIMAPLTPFVAEMIWQELKEVNDSTSVHLSLWPNLTPLPTDERLLENMALTQKLVEKALKERALNKIKVRQPLATLTIKENLPKAFHSLLADELNVKTITVDSALTAEVWLDTTITPELQTEGHFRELIRLIQEKRKELELNQSDRIILTLSDAEAIKKIVAVDQTKLEQVAGVAELKWGGEGAVVEIDDGLTTVLDITRV